MTRFLPGRHPIDAFGNGGFRFGGMSHQGSVLVVPSGMQAISLASIEELQPHHLSPMIAEKGDVDLLILGTGKTMQRPPTAALQMLAKEGLHPDFMDTHAAVRTYNVVVAENRRVAALLIAVDHAG